MSRDLFSDVVSPAVRVRSNSRLTLFVSIVGHALIVAAVVIVPLLATSVLPDPATGAVSFLLAAPAPPAPVVPLPPPRVAPAVPALSPDAAPIVAPDGFKEEAPAPTPAGDFAAGGVDLGPRGSGGAIGTDVGTAIATPAPAPPPVPQKPVRTGGAIREPVKVTHVAPIYPQIAAAARVGGIVIIDAVIGTDGVVRETRVLRSVPLLDRAALDAVRQWRYTPTTLNGVPVPVIMSVTVEFKLH